MVKKAVHYVNKYFEESILSLCMGYFTLAVIMTVVFRHWFGISAAWLDETARYAFIWMMFIGSAVAAKHGTHITVDILSGAIKNEKIKRTLALVSKLIFFVFAVMTTVIGIQVCLTLLEFPQRSPVLQISIFWVYLSMPVGMGLTTLRILQSFFKKNDKTEEQGDTPAIRDTANEGGEA